MIFAASHSSTSDKRRRQQRSAEQWKGLFRAKREQVRASGRRVSEKPTRARREEEDPERWDGLS